MVIFTYCTCNQSRLVSQLIARITKHGWFDGDKKVFVFRDILDEVGKFLRVSQKKLGALITDTLDYTYTCNLVRIDIFITVDSVEHCVASRDDALGRGCTICQDSTTLPQRSYYFIM